MSLVDQTYNATSSSGYFTATLSGIWATAQTVTASWTKIGRFVTLSIPSVNANANSAGFITISGMPGILLPANVSFAPLVSKDNGTYAIGACQVNPNGNFLISPTGSPPFSGSSSAGTSGILACQLNYTVAV